MKNNCYNRRYTHENNLHNHRHYCSNRYYNRCNNRCILKLRALRRGICSRSDCPGVAMLLQGQSKLSQVPGYGIQGRMSGGEVGEGSGPPRTLYMAFGAAGVRLSLGDCKDRSGGRYAPPVHFTVSFQLCYGRRGRAERPPAVEFMRFLSAGGGMPL